MEKELKEEKQKEQEKEDKRANENEFVFAMSEVILFFYALLMKKMCFTFNFTRKDM